MAENELARPSFGQRATPAAMLSAILHNSGKDSAQLVGAHRQVIGSEEHKAISFKRADGHTPGGMVANVQITVVEHLHARRVAMGLIRKDNPASFAVGNTAIGNQDGVARRRVEVEHSPAAVCAADCATVVGEGATARSRIIEEIRYRTTSVGGRPAVVDKGGIAGSRGAGEIYPSDVSSSINLSHKLLCDP